MVKGLLIKLLKCIAQTSLQTEDVANRRERFDFPSPQRSLWAWLSETMLGVSDRSGKKLFL
ncbi:hypothetical protein [Oscillatoria salina]|uniref:hypothetical protein n=1 Tax=Oscillatoria salina TaxID=331517 RepID=UPI0013B8CCE1|nr:hypothetical protein [Oscillatoria salina]MBZ8181985.1 hypothetical protein [Oscillatoria salina IIICB1]NET91350.1 hypothetical protein [Kamptonema sp. SIO1D9]